MKLRKWLSGIITAIVVVSILLNSFSFSLFSFVVQVSAAESAADNITYRELYGENGVIITGCDSDVTNLVIPDEIDGKSVLRIDSEAFSNNAVLTTVVIPDSVSVIGSSAFAYCTALISVKLPSCLTEIADYMFSHCSALEDCPIPYGVTQIGEGAFWRCSALPQIVIPDSVTQLGLGAFQSCEAATSVTISVNLTEIAEQAFEACTSLTSVVLPQNITKINSSAFQECSSLREIVIPSSVTSIGSFCFWQCSELRDVNLPAALTELATAAFQDCTSLTSIAIPAGVSVLSNQIFNGCTALSSVTLLGEPTSVSASAFSSTALSEQKPVYIGNWLYRGDTSAKTFEIREGTVGIADNAFSGCSDLTSVSMPTSLKYIGKNAFYAAEQLTEIVIPELVTDIPEQAFYNCTNLERIQFGENIRSVGADAFDGTAILASQKDALFRYVNRILVYADPNITNISLQNDTIGIAAGVFSENNNLSEAVIPDSVQFLGASIFENCENLTMVQLPESIKSIPDSAFVNCAKLVTVNLPSSLKSIGYRAFGNCTFLNIPEFPDSLTEIGYQAFCGCTAVDSVYIPISVTTIDTMAFGYYWNVYGEPVRISNFVLFGHSATEAERYATEFLITFFDVNDLHGSAGSQIRWSFDYLTGTLSFDGAGNMLSYESSSASPWAVFAKIARTLAFSDAITSIGSHAFSNFRNIRSVRLPDSCTVISDYAFYGCNALQEIVLPKTLEQIGSSAFYGCCLVKEVTLPASLNSLATDAFRAMSSLTAVYVESGNQQYNDVDGVLFNADKTVLLLCPEGKTVINYTVSDNTETIGQYAFYNSSVEEVILPDSLQTIEAYAFYNAAITKLIVPAQVEEIGRYALYGCNSLKNIVFLNRNANYNSYLFGYNVNAPTKVYAYLSEGDWSSVMNAFTPPIGFSWNEMADYDSLTGIQLDRQTLSISAGTSDTITASVNPLIATALNWRSSDEHIAIVMADGLVMGLHEGNCEITVSTPDGSYSNSCTITVTGNADLTAGVRQVYDGAADDSGTCFRANPIVCESLGGVYFLTQDELIFYSLYTDEQIPLYSIDFSVRSSFVQGDRLYLLTVSDNKSKVIVYHLLEQREEHQFVLPTFIASAIGADALGRVYLAGEDINDAKDYILLFTAEGEELSRTYTASDIQLFDAFDATNGNYYFECDANWRYWGYNHDVRVLRAGRVTGNSIAVNDNETLITLYQRYVSDHANSVAMLNEQYLAIHSGFYSDQNVVSNSMLYVMDSNAFDPMNSQPQFSKVISRATPGDSYYSCIGTLAAYRGDYNAIIAYENDSRISQYHLTDGTLQAQYQLTRDIYSMFGFEDMIAVIEKDDAGYYLELIQWQLPSELSVSGKSGMVQGEVQQLSVSTNADFDTSITWTSSDPYVATVDKNGFVFAWHAGTTVISATSSNGLESKIELIVSDADRPSWDAVVIGEGSVSSNVSTNNYTVWSKPVNSYLHQTDDGVLERIEYISGSVVVERYSDNGGKLTDNFAIGAPLPIFGGCFTGEQYNFLVFGHDNLQESDTQEVIRIMKYTKDWVFVESASVFGANTYIPFDAGSLRMVETGGKLYLYTCHEMYDEGDGLHHQANMTFVYDQETMAQEQAYYDVLNIAQAGYVSHSFNQFVRTDDTYLYRVDHGDAYPRGISITRCDIGGDITDVSYTVPFSISGGIGNNSTGASVGGFELSSSGCIIAGNSVDQNADVYNASARRNIFISVTDKNLLSGYYEWITHYTEEDGITPRTPQLVKINDYAFLLMWEEYNDATGKTTTKTVTLDGSGNLTSEIISINASLSDCQPFVDDNGLVHWYVTDNSTPLFYTIDPLCSETFVSPEDNIEWSFDETTGVLTINSTGIMYSGGVYPWSELAEQVTAVVIADGVTSIGMNAFLNFSKLKTVSIAESVVRIEKGAFSHCTSLTSIQLPIGITSIGDSVFESCTSLTMISIPKNVVLIGKDAFAYCSALKCVYLPESLQTIDSFAFSICNSLSDVYYGGTITDWQYIVIGEYGNSALLTAELHPSSDELPTPGDITEPSTEPATNPTTTPDHTPTTKPTTENDKRILGDMNGDGNVTAADARIALRISAKIEKGSDEQLAVADVDKNGKVTAADARLILRFSAKLITSFE